MIKQKQPLPKDEQRILEERLSEIAYLVDTTLDPQVIINIQADFERLTGKLMVHYKREEIIPYYKRMLRSTQTRLDFLVSQPAYEPAEPK